MEEFEEQIDKSKYFEQQGSGRLSINKYHSVSGKRGKGLLSLARRYAYPVFQSFMRYAKPVARDIFSGAQTVAKDTVKNAAKRKLDEIASNIGISENGVKPKRKAKAERKPKPKRKLKRKVSIKPKPKKNKASKSKKPSKKSRKPKKIFHDIFK